MTDDKGLRQRSVGQTAPSVLESREHLEAILQGVADGVVVHDSDGAIAYANEAAAQLFGVSSPLSLLSGSIQDALAPFDLFDTHRAPLAVDDLPAWEVFHGSSAARRAIICRQRETGEDRWWIVYASPVRDDAERVRYVVCILRDVTDRAHGAQANARLAAVVTSSSDAIITRSLDAIITSWNPAAERLYGYSADEAIGQPAAILVPVDRHAEMAAKMERLRAGEHLEAFEGVRIRKDSTQVDVALTLSPIFDQDGRFVGVSSIERDITAQRRAQDALQLLAEAGEVLGASLDYETTLAGLAELIVPRLADWCSVNTFDDTGKPTQLALAHVDPEQVSWVRALQESMPYGVEETSDIARVQRTGEPVIYREITDEMLVAGARTPEHLAALRQLGFRSGIVVPMITRGRVVGTMTLVYAESGRLYHDDEIALAQEIARRAAIAVDNAGLYADAQHAARAREDFLLTASHELRTPLTSVKASAQLVSRYLDQPQPDRTRIVAMIARLQGEIGRLETLSLDLLDAARIQRGRFELQPEPSELVALAREVLAGLERSGYRLPAHRLVMDAGEPVSGVWDPQRLRQVVSNLISNALKYSPAGGEIRVRVLREGDAALLVVEDEGIGIDAAEAARLFQPFERGTAVRHSIGGVGLGLYITRQIVDAHGGTISLDSTPGAGSRFTVRLPVA